MENKAMNRYYDVALERMKTSNDPKKAQEVVKLLDEMVLTPMMQAHPEMYWAFRRAEHELYNGAHYDELYAMWEVSQMHHKSKDGGTMSGEHWGLADAQKVYMQYKAHLPHATMYDVYVALNAEWHDKIELFTMWFADKAEEKIIESAITFYFMDSDAPEGKVWRYMNCMRDV